MVERRPDTDPIPVDLVTASACGLDSRVNVFELNLALDGIQ
jgi:K+-transporting ATPase c subunit